MTSLSTNSLAPHTHNRLQLGEQILNLMVRIALKSPKYRLISRYCAMSDEELARLGMTRADVARKVYGPYSCM
ncbi:MAG: hypothetical protein EA339_14020 [Rhodobacteraceae bacterium]|nr:MAG: hypothetical protein EA339_14020 [Paracoccaceae bacterium]